jgi:pyruvate kinase
MSATSSPEVLPVILLTLLFAFCSLCITVWPGKNVPPQHLTHGSEMNKTKIVATLGPSSSSDSFIALMIEAGMNVARINLSHGDTASHKKYIELVKRARKKTSTFTAILLDTRGPEIRVGEFARPVVLKKGGRVRLSPGGSSCTAESISVNYSGLAGDISAGNRILLDDGRLLLKVDRVEADTVFATVVVGGPLSSRKRVSLPDCAVNLPSLSEEDVADIRLGVRLGVDFIAASFVRSSEDVRAVKKVIAENGGDVDVIAKIENRQGVENLEEILSEADGLMVARGDLGVEMPAEQVPVIQKKIIRAANLAGKPVITATQMLESMINSPTPTRAEASDVTNAIFDGTDAVMLSAETAVGASRIEAIQFLVRCAVTSEAALDYSDILAAGVRHKRRTVTDAISYACCATAADLGAAAIISCTTSGSTARMVARHRPGAPVIAVSPNRDSLKKLQLIRGVTTLISTIASTLDEELENSANVARKFSGLIGNGDLVVITAGVPIGSSGTTNMLKVRKMEDIFLTGQPGGGGQATGRTRLINSEDDLDNMHELTVLVVKELDESILSSLSRLCGIITEQPLPDMPPQRSAEGVRLPLICNVADAFRIFENDMIVSMDGDTGRIVYGGLNTR